MVKISKDSLRKSERKGIIIGKIEATQDTGCVIIKVTCCGRTEGTL